MNPQPRDYESPALTVELQALLWPGRAASTGLPGPVCIVGLQAGQRGFDLSSAVWNWRFLGIFGGNNAGNLSIPSGFGAFTGGYFAACGEMEICNLFILN